MGELIKRIAINLIERGNKIDPSDFVTQDTINFLIDIGKEIIHP